MPQKNDDVRIAVLETKFETLIKAVQDMHVMVEKFSESVIKDHRAEIDAMRLDNSATKIELALVRKTSEINSKRIGWMSGVIWSFLSLVGLSVFGAMVNTVLK